MFPHGIAEKQNVWLAELNAADQVVFNYEMFKELQAGMVVSNTPPSDPFDGYMREMDIQEVRFSQIDGFDTRTTPDFNGDGRSGKYSHWSDSVADAVGKAREDFKDDVSAAWDDLKDDVSSTWDSVFGNDDKDKKEDDITAESEGGGARISQPVLHEVIPSQNQSTLPNYDLVFSNYANKYTRNQAFQNWH